MNALEYTDYIQVSTVTSLIALILLFMSTAIDAAPGNSAPEKELMEPGSNAAYVDSVNEWGAWELGIEPAAGPLKAGERPLNIRPSDTRFRPTDSHLFQTDGTEITSGPPPAPIIPPPPPAPVIPPPTPVIPTLGQGTPGNPQATGRP